jgi:hypothetical protein
MAISAAAKKPFNSANNTITHNSIAQLGTTSSDRTTDKSRDYGRDCLEQPAFWHPQTGRASFSREKNCLSNGGNGLTSAKKPGVTLVLPPLADIRPHDIKLFSFSRPVLRIH